MDLADVNVLVHAFRPDSSEHERCNGWLDSLINGSSRYGISNAVLSGFVRIVTHSRVFANPSRLHEALDFCEVIRVQPHCVPIEPGPMHWKIFVDLCVKAEARGNLIPDAWFAAMAIESGCCWVTLDRDFARFNGLNWMAPPLTRVSPRGGTRR